jgi:hypothetical protein
MPFSKSNIFLLLLLISPVFLSAQNYCTINKKSLNYFLCSNGDYKPIKIKTVQIIGNDTVLYPVKESYYVFDPDFYCDHIDTICFIGSHILIKPNGINIFYDTAGKEIAINTLANKGDAWNMFLCKDSSRFEAKVDSIYFGQILSGLNDSIKVITLKYLDKFGNLITHPANNGCICISKNYGLLSFWNFISLPEKTPKYSSLTYNLVGMSHPKVGYQNIDATSIYNFDIGDEIHTKFHQEYKYYYVTMPCTETSVKDTFCIRKVIDKFEKDDTFYYLVHRYMNSTYYYCLGFQQNQITDTNYFEDTVIEKYSKISSDLDRLPYMSVYTYFSCVAGGGYRLDSYKPELYFGIIRTKRNDIGEQIKFNLNDTCLESCYEQPFSDYENFYEGLGGPFYYRTYDFDFERRTGFEDYELLYYKKGSKEWGSPIIIEDTNIKRQTISILLAPNPASDRIKISCKSNDQICQLTVTDISGKTVKHMDGIYSSAYEMDCSDLHDGLYFICIITGTEEIFRKQFLIVR